MLKSTEAMFLPHTLFLAYVISVFQPNNAKPHIAGDNIQFLRNNIINFIDDWPSKSPDLNPIGHLWDNLDTRVQPRQNLSGNVNELREALLEDWNNIPQAQINNLIYSMRRRCQAVRNVCRGHTGY